MRLSLSSAITAAISLAALSSAQTLTGQYTCSAGGQYTLCQNLWGELSGVGNQTSTLISQSGNAVSWSTTWNWANNPNNVKSYANVISNTAKGVQLQNIASAPTTWNWVYETQSAGIRADVSYDIWFGKAPSGSPATTASSYEIMIWLSGLGGIQPVGSAIKTNITVAGHQWDLWSGPNANWQVFSFKTASGDITNFDVDLQEFFSYLTTNEGVAGSQYVQAIQTGTEPFTGNAVLLTESYSVAINSK
ncbi:glycoside hydrolase family 12 protein [Collybiopsis luxurians FD-317 M1]|uniref:Unplaced genomic scaffold GYMLUscaffold_24, whole genome shotgun sequence n=1 Tax=Collybiopsis luxurians FD-317 M1 TaxID=944289 RepID=A0A0D0BZE6_9AGAR|nr:glycoside hydrolase family 12 protein [Collybiopsis luxurians FD-317 M1]